jgi:fatty-acyl-CoA synthase
LANALTALGVSADTRVATFLWNDQTHLEAYLAVPTMGAILHTLNIRLSPEQLAFVINDAHDEVIIVDTSLVGLLARVRDQIPHVRHIIVKGVDADGVLGDTLSYDALLANSSDHYEWPDLDERQAAILCYTSGTTGNPKGVLYSHRSTWLHSMVATTSNSVALCEGDRALLVVPMFHVNAWGVAYAAFFAGTELIMPSMLLKGEYLLQMIEGLRPTIALGVPTLWNDLLRAAQEKGDADFSSLRSILAGGSAVPRVMIETFRERHGVDIMQGWGMTETSPLCALAVAPRQASVEEEMDWRSRTGRVVPGVEVRICGDDGTILPNDGVSVGEFEVRGPWITGSYYLDPAPDRFHDGWLRTGDIGTLDARGFMQISDRTKDVIKSGGEWISSVELEIEVMAHPDVVEAAVIAVPDERWSERPLVALVLEEGTETTVEDVMAFLVGRVSRWWLPERWAIIDEVPKTSVGKFDKKVLRARYADGELKVLQVDPSGGA